MTSIATVNRMRCRSSGILKIFVNAEIMGRTTRSTANNYSSPGLFNSLPRGFAEFVGFDRQFFREFATTKNLQTIRFSVHEPFFAEELLIDVRIVFELFEVAQIDKRIRGLERRVIKPPLWQSPDKRHLTAFEPKPDASSRTGLLALMTFAARFSVTGTLAAPQSLNPVL